MKRIYIALALIALSIAMAVTAHIVFERKITALSEGLYTLLDLSETEQIDVLKKETEKLILLWNQSSPALHIIAIHKEMDCAETSITSLYELLENSTLEEYKLGCIRAINEFKNLLDSEKLTLDNVLQMRSPILQFVHNTEKYHRQYS